MNWLLFANANVNLNGMEISGHPLVVLPVTIAVVIGFFVSIAWMYGDAQARGKSGCLALLFCVMGWPISILWWLWLRPETLRRGVEVPPPNPPPNKALR